jgi:predicted nucleic acid-binding protein
MHKQRIYIDTSVIGGCFDEEFAEWSNKLFDEFIKGRKIAVVSDLTIEELEGASDNIKNKLREIPTESLEFLQKNEEANELANLYIEGNAISIKSLSDATHIALATIAKVNVLVSWNFKHIVNLRRIYLYNSINLQNNYPIIEIRTPREILENE